MFDYKFINNGYLITIPSISNSYAPSNYAIAEKVNLTTTELSEILITQFNSSSNSIDNLFENETDVQNVVEWLNSLVVAKKLAE